MNIFTLSSLLTVISCILIALLSLWKGRGQKVSTLFALFCLSASIWGLGGVGFSTSKSPTIALRWWQISYIGVIITPVLYLHFVLAFVKLKNKFTLYIFYIITGIFLFFNWYDNSRLFLGNDLRILFNQFYYIIWTKHKNIIFIIFYIILYWILLGYAFFLLLKAYKKSTGAFRNQLKYFILGSIIGWAGAHGDYLPIFGITIYPYNNFFIAIYPLIYAYAIIKHKLLDIEVFITRAMVFALSYGVTFGLPFIIFAFWRRPIHTLFHSFPWAIPTSVMGYAGLATITPFVYICLRRKAENIILAKQKHYQRLLLESSKTLLREHSLSRLLNSTGDIIKKTVKINFVAIFLKDQDDNNFVLKVIKGYKCFPVSSFSPDKDNFIKLLKKKKSPLIIDEINPKLNISVEKKFQLIVPIFIEDKLIGFLGLGEKEDNSLYTEDDINVFEILSRQVALAIDHCKFLEEYSETQEKIFQAEKLASIGGMADGVAHQIKNRLNFFSIVSGEIKSNADEFMKRNFELVDKNPELKNYIDYVSEIGDSLINNVRKTNNIIEGILSFARTGEKGNFFSDFSLKEIIDTALGLLLVKHHINNFPLKIENDSSDIVYGVKSQILECIYNILDNCYEAIKEKIEYHLAEDEKKTFKPIIQLLLKEKGNFNVIEINDNGIGIKEENKQKIFAPFFTTKPSNKSGTGIGMYVVKRIIEENHQGSVRFESEYMKGTKLFIKIPKNKSPKVVARIKKTDLALAN